MAIVYILHFDKSFWGNCRHYVGYTKLSLEARIAKHRNGTGSKLVKYALQQGCNFVVAWSREFATVEEARKEELRLKKCKNLSRHCCVCLKKPLVKKEEDDLIPF
jgi:predicted GIY-YIG superfamily endonuclease